jgi:hypothetical protein
MEEFKKKLVKARAYKKFMRNMKESYGKHKTFESHCQATSSLLRPKTSFFDFVQSAFVWKQTPEGFEYWRKIAKM